MTLPRSRERFRQLSERRESCRQRNWRAHSLVEHGPVSDAAFPTAVDAAGMAGIDWRNSVDRPIIHSRRAVRRCNHAVEIPIPDFIAIEDFQDTLEGDRLLFDYRLRPGVVTRRNALDLMRLVGIEVHASKS